MKFTTKTTEAGVVLTRNFAINRGGNTHEFPTGTQGKIIEMPDTDTPYFLPENFDYAFQVQKNDFKPLELNSKVIVPQLQIDRLKYKEIHLLEQRIQEENTFLQYHREQFLYFQRKLQLLQSDPVAYFQTEDAEYIRAGEGLSSEADYILNAPIGRVLLPTEHGEEIEL